MNHTLQLTSASFGIPLTPITPTKERGQSLIDKHLNANLQIISLVAVMEKYEIAIPNFKQFRLSFNEQLKLFDKAFYAFLWEVQKFLSIDVPDDKVQTFGTKVLIQKPPDKDQIKVLEELAWKYHGECVQLLGFTTDLSIEAQNNLVGSLFDFRLPSRNPTDPSALVLTTDSDTIKQRPPGSLV